MWRLWEQRWPESITGKEEGFYRGERQEETVADSGVGGGRLVVGMDTCGGYGGVEDGGGSG